MIKKERTMANETISLREYFDKRFDDLKAFMEVKFENIEKSTLLAQDALNARLESMNEFRSAMKDQAGQFITRTECHLSKDKIIGDIQTLRESDATTKGGATQRDVTIARFIAIGAILLSSATLLSNFFFKH
jgi:hypothetical protein